MAREKSRAAAFAGLVLYVFLSGMTYSVAAADRKGDFAVKGAGTMTCEELLDAVSNESIAAARASGWLTGYITANNQHLDDVFDLLPWQDERLVFAQVLENCKRNRQAKLYAVARAAVELLRNDAITSREKYLSITVNDKTAFLYESTLKRAKRRLNAKLAIELPVDASVDQKVVEALVKFQIKAGLPQTGFFDQRTLANLLIAAPKGQQ